MGNGEVVATVAGTGEPDAFAGDGGPATDAGVSPSAVALDSQRRKYASS